MKKKGAVLPKEHFERNMEDVACGDQKYASKSTMDNAQDMKKSVDGLVGFARSHKMKY